MKHLRQYTNWVVAFVFAVAVITVYKTFDNLKNITDFFGTIISAMGPFIAAFAMAYVLNLPAMKIRGFLEKRIKIKWVKKHSHGISVALVYIIAVLLLVITLSRLIPAFYNNIMDLYTNFPTYWKNMINYLSRFEIFQRMGLSGEEGFDIYNAIYGLFDKFDFTQFSKYASGVMNFTSGILDAVIALIASIYMLLDKERLQRGIMRVAAVIIPAEKVNSIAKWMGEVNSIFTNYIYSRLVCGLITGAACAIILMIFNVKYALMLGIFIGLMDLIPYFGSIISCVISIMITLITGGIFKAIYAGVALLIMQQIDGNLLAPKIMGDSLEIRPITIIFGVTVGGTLFGFLGMLLSVPVLAVIKSVLSAQIQTIERKKSMAREAEDADE
ncbi:MAG: AI-2E family transporter [Clostridiales bacterium]|nr:AI-2E family transporter [Clostridiales bacterium]